MSRRMGDCSCAQRCAYRSECETPEVQVTSLARHLGLASALCYAVDRSPSESLPPLCTVVYEKSGKPDVSTVEVAGSQIMAKAPFLKRRQNRSTAGFGRLFIRIELLEEVSHITFS